MKRGLKFLSFALLTSCSSVLRNADQISTRIPAMVQLPSQVTEEDFLKVCYLICGDFKDSIGMAKYKLSEYKRRDGPDRDLLIALQEAIVSAIEINRYDKRLVRNVLEKDALLITAETGFVPSSNNFTAMDTAVIYDYTGYTASHLNTYLRQSNPAEGNYKTYRDFLMAALEKLPSYIGEVVRETDKFPKWEQIYRLSAIVTEKGFTSTTKKSEGSSGRFLNDLTFRIRSLNGKDVSAVSHRPEEQEVLFKPGTHFLVESIQHSLRNPDGFEVRLVEIPSDSTNDPKQN